MLEFGGSIVCSIVNEYTCRRLKWYRYFRERVQLGRTNRIEDSYLRYIVLSYLVQHVEISYVVSTVPHNR